MFCVKNMTKLPDLTVSDINDNCVCILGWVKFSEWKKQFVVVAKYVEDPKKMFFTLFKLNCFAKLLLQQDICLKSASYPLLPGLVRPNIKTNSGSSKNACTFNKYVLEGL